MDVPEEKIVDKVPAVPSRSGGERGEKYITAARLLKQRKRRAHRRRLRASNANG